MITKISEIQNILLNYNITWFQFSIKILILFFIKLKKSHTLILFTNAIFLLLMKKTIKRLLSKQKTINSNNWTMNREIFYRNFWNNSLTAKIKTKKRFYFILFYCSKVKKQCAKYEVSGKTHKNWWFTHKRGWSTHKKKFRKYFR